MTYLILGLIVFLGTHALTTNQELRAKLVGVMGEGGYKFAYSLVSLVGLVILVWGFGQYRSEGYIQLWTPPKGMNHLAVALMLPAMVLLVAAYLSGEIKRRVKHPMITSVKIWALAHLLANGDLGSIILFLGVLAWAVYARISMKTRLNQGVSEMPVGFSRNDIIAIVAGVVFWAAIVFKLHPLLIGVSVL